MARPTALEKSLGYQFRDLGLLEQALTHGSVRESQSNNERLEFLGDGVLNCIISSVLYERYPQLSEGKLSLMRSALVRNEALSGIARGLQLSIHLRLGGGERASGVEVGDSILADALEAVYGAVFIDGGYAAARDAVIRNFAAVLANFDSSRPAKDFKTRLQEYLQGRRHPPPKYFVVQTQGEPHRKTYEVECVVAPLDLRASGRGRSRRAAEQDAAEQILKIIGK